MTEAANINARTRPLPRKNFRILFMVQRLPLQPALPLRLLTLSGEGAEVVAAAAAAEPSCQKAPPAREHSRKQPSKGRAQLLPVVSLCLRGIPQQSICARSAGPGEALLETALWPLWEQSIPATRQFNGSLLSSPRAQVHLPTSPRKGGGPAGAAASLLPVLRLRPVTQHHFS